MVSGNMVQSLDTPDLKFLGLGKNKEAKSEEISMEENTFFLVPTSVYVSTMCKSNGLLRAANHTNVYIAETYTEPLIQQMCSSGLHT